MLDKEIQMWLERRLFEVDEKLDKLTEERAFIIERLEGHHPTKCPRQYFNVPTKFNMVHGSDLLRDQHGLDEMTYRKYVKEYITFLKQS